jgi:YD repeat-containing protein
VVTNYAYDGMNRVVSKIYTGGNPATPSVLYCYDGQISSANSNASCNKSLTAGAGTNLVSELTYAGVSSTIFSEYTQFDYARRPKAGQQATNGTTYPFSYGYDLAGDLTSITYPSTRQVTYAYDQVPRPTSATGSFNATQTPYASNVTYAPQGAVLNLPLGSGVTEAWTYDLMRLQPTSMTATLAGTSPTNLLSLGWTWYPSGAASLNNGNLQAATITRVLGGKTYSYSQSYNYDAYNRLASATETSGWAQNYALRCIWQPGSDSQFLHPESDADADGHYAVHE